MVSAGQIHIDLTAGTAKFVQDMEKAKGKVIEFSSAHRSSVSDVQAASAAIRAFEGNITTNTRAVERFLGSVLGAGPLLRAAFPVVGAIAFGSVIVETGKKVYDFFKQIQQAPEKISGQFNALNSSLKTSNDEMSLSNIKLENEIAKLEHKPQNKLAEALMEAKVAADRLAESLNKDLDAMGKLLQENAGSGWNQFFQKYITGDKTSGVAKQLHDELVGQTGFGGFQASIRNVSDPTTLQKMYSDEIKKIQGIYQGIYDTKSGGSRIPEQGVQELFSGALQNLTDEMNGIGLSTQHSKLEGQKGSLEIATEQKKPLLEELTRLQKELNQATAQGVTQEQKIEAEYRTEMQDMSARNVLNSQTLTLLNQIYDAKRLDAYNLRMKDLVSISNEFVESTQKMEVEQTKELAKATEDVNVLLDKQVEIQHKLAVQNDEIQQATRLDASGHNVRMAGIYGATRQTMAQLEYTQQLADIQNKYNHELDLTNDAAERQKLLLEQQLEVQKAQEQLEEKLAQERQKDVSDFFRDMEQQAQTAGNILYQSLHKGLDDVSSELADLMTGKKTSFGRMFQNLGHQMLQSSIHSGLQQGLGALGHKFGINIPGTQGKPGSSPNNPLYTKDVGGLGGSGSVGGIDFGKVAGSLTYGSSSDSGSGSGGGLFSGVTGMISHFAGFFADGGDISPYHVGIAGEAGPEIVKGPATVIPLNKLGGGGTTYNIDARGADLGAHNRISRALEATHSSAVKSSVQAQHQKTSRTPQRSHK